MSNKLKLAALAMTVAVGTFAASLGSAHADTIIVKHGWGHRHRMCVREGGIYQGDGVCTFPGRVSYRHHYGYGERVYRTYNTNGYWSDGVWHNY